MNLDALIAFFQELTVDSVARFPEFYAEDAWFKDPFNEVSGLPAIQHIFSHMYRQVDEPRFVIIERVADEHGAMLTWEFHCRLSLLGRSEALVMRGASHLKFNEAGKVSHHRDYWDTAEELYMKLPLLGPLMRALRRKMAA